MKKLTILDSNPSQSLYFVTEDGIVLHLKLVYRPRSQAWFLDIESDDFNVSGIQVCCYSNILDKYRNQLTYGIAVITTDGLDPWRVDDFESGYCSMCFLNKEELQRVTRVLNGE